MMTCSLIPFLFCQRSRAFINFTNFFSSSVLPSLFLLRPTPHDSLLDILAAALQSKQLKALSSFCARLIEMTASSESLCSSVTKP